MEKIPEKKTSEPINEESWFGKLGLNKTYREGLLKLASEAPDSRSDEYRTFAINQNVFVSAVLGYDQAQESSLENSSDYVDEIDVFVLQPDDQKANAAALVSRTTRMGKGEGPMQGGHNALYVSARQLGEMDPKIKKLIDSLIEEEDVSQGNIEFSVNFVSYNSSHSGPPSFSLPKES